MTLWIKQQGLCWLCMEPMVRFTDKDDPMGVSRDHLRPRSRGGASKSRNYLLAHRKCNTDRGAPKLTATNAEIQVLKREALERLKLSHHWVEDFKDPANGAFRGSMAPGSENVTT